MAPSPFDKFLGEYLEATRPKTWKDVVPNCTCSEENNWFCPACLKWYADSAY